MVNDWRGRFDDRWFYHLFFVRYVHHHVRIPNSHKKRLFLLAGYQEETFVGDKEKLAKISGFFFLYNRHCHNLITIWLRNNW